MVEARGLQKSLPSNKIVYCTMEVTAIGYKLKIVILLTESNALLVILLEESGGTPISLF